MSEPVGPLDGTLVLEVANWIAGPCCGALLADAGATVRPCVPAAVMEGLSCSAQMSLLRADAADPL